MRQMLQVRFGFANHLAITECLTSTRSERKKKSIRIGHIYLIGVPQHKNHTIVGWPKEMASNLCWCFKCKIYDVIHNHSSMYMQKWIREPFNNDLLCQSIINLKNVVNLRTFWNNKDWRFYSFTKKDQNHGTAGPVILKFRTYQTLRLSSKSSTRPTLGKKIDLIYGVLPQQMVAVAIG